MGNGLANADYAVIIGFFVVMIAIGVYFSRRMKTMSDFFGGGKQVPWWLAGISFYMCTFSALGFVSYSELAYKYGWVAVTIWWTTVPCLLFVAKLFASRWRRIAETSPLEYIEHRYDNSVRQGLVWLTLPSRIFDDALKLFAIGTVIAVGMGFPIKWAIWGSGLIMISYTFMGGLWATLVADFIQFIVLIAGVIVLPFLVFQRVGGISAFVDKAPEGFFNLTAGTYTWPYLAMAMMLSVLTYSTSWALVQRYYSVDSDKSARKVGYLVAFLNIIGPPVFYVPAMVARTFITDISNYKEVYPLVCKAVLPIGMIGLVIAAMFAATMSMVAGDFNAVASVLTNDFYKRVLGRKASERKLLLVSRLNTLLIGLAVIGITFALLRIQKADELVNLMFKIFSLFLPPVAIPMLLGMLTRRVSSKGALFGLWGGVAIGVIAFIIGKYIAPIGSFDFEVLLTPPVMFCITTSATLLGILFGMLFFPDSAEQRKRVEEFFKKVDNPSPVVTPTDQVAGGAVSVSPLPIIGFGVIVIGLVLLISVLVSVGFAQSKLSSTVGACIIAVGVLFLWLGKMAKKS